MSDFWQQAKQIVGTVAPTLATALGGPLAGMATRAITGALLGQDAATDDPDAAMRAIQGATPADLLALKKADQEFQLQMKQAGVKLEEIAAQDRDSARQREIKTGDSWTPRVLGALAIVMFAALTGWMVSGFAVIDPSYATMVGILIGTLGTIVVQVYNYYFGSSAGSKSKDGLLGKLTNSKT
jgi:hypothetical protein